MHLFPLQRALFSSALLLLSFALHAQCLGPIEGIVAIPTGNWQAFSLPPTLSVERTIITTAGSNSITVTGCTAQLLSASVSGQGIPAGATVVGGTCPDLELNAPALSSGTTVATFLLPGYTAAAPPANSGVPSGIHCSLAPATFQAAVCAGQFATYYMCPNNVYTFSLCTSEPWNSTITVTDASGTTLAAGSTTFDDDGCGLTDGHAQLSFTPASAGTYRVRVLTAACTVDPALCGRLDVNVTPVALPVNDEPQGAIELTPGSTCSWQEASLAFATNSGSTTPNIPTNCGPAPCSPGSGLFSGRDVWFRVTIPLSGRVEVRTEMIDGADMAMAAYDGPVDDLFQLFGPTFCASCNDDASDGNAAPYLYFPVLQPGTTLYLRVWPRGGSPLSTDFRICVTDPQPPANDRPCTALDLPVAATCDPLPLSTLFATGNNPGVTLSPNPPTCAPTSTADVWTRVVMPDAPALRIAAQHGTVDSLALVAYTLTSGNVCATATLTQVACAVSASPSAPPEFLLDGAAGTVYWLRTYAVGGAPGTFSLCATALEPPVNDEPCGALPLTVVNGCLPQRFSTTYASTSATTSTGAISVPAPTAPCAIAAPQNDVWFTATVPANGELRLEMEPTALTDAALAVYTAAGACTEGSLSLTQWDCATAGSAYGAAMPVVIASGLEPGSSVYVRVWRESGAEGDVLLCAGTTTVPTEACSYRIEAEDLNGEGWGADGLTYCSIDPIAGGVEVCDVMRFAGNHGWIHWSAGATPSLSLSFVGAASSAALARLTVTELNSATVIIDRLFNPAAPTGIVVPLTNCLPTPTPADCSGAIRVCEDSTLSIFSQDPDLIHELNSGNAGCLTDTSVLGNWHTITLNTDGTLAFTLTPLEPTTDLNWAIWGPTTATGTCDLNAPPIRCSKALVQGPTGLSATALESSEDESGDGFVKSIPPTTLRNFALFVYARGVNDVAFDISFQNDPNDLVNCEGIPTGLSTQLREDALLLIPNPAHDHIRLTGQGLNMIRSWELITTVGAVLSTGSSSGNGLTIDVSGMPSGVHVLRTVDTDGTIRQFRWVKQ